MQDTWYDDLYDTCNTQIHWMQKKHGDDLESIMLLRTPRNFIMVFTCLPFVQQGYHIYLVYRCHKDVMMPFVTHRQPFMAVPSHKDAHMRVFVNADYYRVVNIYTNIGTIVKTAFIKNIQHT